MDQSQSTNDLSVMTVYYINQFLKKYSGYWISLSITPLSADCIIYNEKAEEVSASNSLDINEAAMGAIDAVVIANLKNTPAFNKLVSKNKEVIN